MGGHHVTVVPARGYRARCEPCEVELETIRPEALREFVREHGGHAEYLTSWDIGDDDFDPAVVNIYLNKQLTNIGLANAIATSEFSSLTDD
jgi:hypothetical protein